MKMLNNPTGLLLIASDSYGLKCLIQLMITQPWHKELAWARKMIFTILEDILTPLSNHAKHIYGANLMANYICLVLIALIHNGLIEALIQVSLRGDNNESNDGFPQRARTLLNHIESLSGYYLPKTLSSRITSIPKAVAGMHMTMITALSHPVVVSTSAHGINPPPIVSSDGTTNNLTNNTDNNNNNNNSLNKKEKKERVVAQTICHELGSIMDLNSTFVKLQDRKMINFENNNNNNNENVDLKNCSYFSLKAQKIKILVDLKRDQITQVDPYDCRDYYLKSTVSCYKDFTYWDLNQTWSILNGLLRHEPNLQGAINKCRYMKVRVFDFIAFNLILVILLFVPNLGQISIE